MPGTRPAGISGADAEGATGPHGGCCARLCWREREAKEIRPARPFPPAPAERASNGNASGEPGLWRGRPRRKGSCCGKHSPTLAPNRNTKLNIFSFAPQRDK